MPDEPEQTEGSPPIVVIAEDEEPIAQALSIIVEDYGLTPLVATHGKQALELVRRHHPALVITDLMMPQMTGSQLIVAVRAEAVAANRNPPPIVLMSAASKQYMHDAGADATLVKPFDIRQVEELLRRFALSPEAG